jgi:hypothetical protein
MYVSVAYFEWEISKKTAFEERGDASLVMKIDATCFESGMVWIPFSLPLVILPVTAPAIKGGDGRPQYLYMHLVWGFLSPPSPS